MSACAFGCLHNDVAAVQLDGGIAITHGNGELSALVHLYQRAITQTHHGMGGPGGTDFLSLKQLVTDLEQTFSVRAYAIQHPVQLFYLRPHAGRAGEELLLDKISRNSKHQDGCGCGHPTEAAV